MARFLPPEEHLVLYETGFGEDILGRAPFGKNLSEIVERIEDPLVIALDGRWGTGKSHFLKRWVGAHKTQNEGRALTVYFDAFANDYLADPLVALVGSLTERLKEERPEANLSGLKNAAVKIIKPLARIGLNVATFGAKDALGDLEDAFLDAAKGETDRAIENLWQREEGRRAAMEEFHAAVSALTAPSAEGESSQPLAIVIDELDRCRPDYALEILEVIKHFFELPHVHFILGVNLEVLEDSVRTRYGSGIDASAYLRKFLSFTMTLPEDVGDQMRTPVLLRYIEDQGNLMGTPNHLLKAISEQLRVWSRKNNISIREAGKILSWMAILPSKSHQSGFPVGLREVVITLVIIKVAIPNLYSTFLNTSIDSMKLLDLLGLSEEVVSDKKAGKYIYSDEDNIAYNTFSVWMFILNGDDPDRDRHWDWVASIFGRYHNMEDNRRIPRTVHRDYLSVFRLA